MIQQNPAQKVICGLSSLTSASTPRLTSKLANAVSSPVVP